MAATILQYEQADECQVEFLRRTNDTWRITAGAEVFYLKAHTSSWYGGEAHLAEEAVRREVTGHRLLAEAGLATPEIVAYSTGSENPLGWPYVLTRALAGLPLADVLPTMATDDAAVAVRAVGEHLARMHTLTFDHPGFLTFGPPTRPLVPDTWQHPMWRFERFLTVAFAALAADTKQVPASVMDSAVALLADNIEALRDSYQPPSFLHGDCLPDQFFVARDHAGWKVTGVVDLEVASAGCPLFDLAKFCLYMTSQFRATPLNWSTPLLESYGPVDHNLIRLLFLVTSHREYAGHSLNLWPGTRAQLVTQIVNARTWHELVNPSGAQAP